MLRGQLNYEWLSKYRRACVSIRVCVCAREQLIHLSFECDHIRFWTRSHSRCYHWNEVDPFGSGLDLKCIFSLSLFFFLNGKFSTHNNHLACIINLNKATNLIMYLMIIATCQNNIKSIEKQPIKIKPTKIKTKWNEIGREDRTVTTISHGNAHTHTHLWANLK